MSNWRIFTEKAYKEKAIHLPGYHHHHKLREVLADARIFIRKTACLPGNDIMSESIFI